MIKMTEQSIEVNTSLDEGLHVLSTKVRNYIIDFGFPGINNLAEIQNKTRTSQGTDRAPPRGHENIRRSDCQPSC